MGLRILLKWLFILPISLVGLVMLLLLPLIVLIKSAVFSYSYGISTFFSLAIGSVATFVVLLVYLLVLDRVVKRRNFLSTRAKFILVSLMIVSFNAYALIEVSEHNVKNKNVASEYQDLHPILRIGVRIWSLFDQRMVITDMSRSKKDYKRMRVAAYRHSLHYSQKDGFVHAVDLRTKRRSKVRNWVSQMVFNMMGFGTLRHIGSADHLHVELVLTKEASIAMNRIARSRLAKTRKRRYAKNRKQRSAAKRKAVQRAAAKRKTTQPAVARQSNQTKTTRSKPDVSQTPVITLQPVVKPESTPEIKQSLRPAASQETSKIAQEPSQESLRTRRQPESNAQTPPLSSKILPKNNSDNSPVISSEPESPVPAFSTDPDTVPSSNSNSSEQPDTEESPAPFQ